jgi:hypothetical protein
LKRVSRGVGFVTGQATDLRTPVAIAQHGPETFTGSVKPPAIGARVGDGGQTCLADYAVTAQIEPAHQSRRFKWHWHEG